MVAFLNVGGTLTPITIPVTDDVVVPEDINNLGQVVGYYYDPADSEEHGFFRDTDGTLTYPIDYPGSLYTIPLGLNDKGLIVGLRQDDVTYDSNSFVIDLSHHFISYDYPGADPTIFRAINNSGLISGDYQDITDGLFHAFIARVGH